MYSAVYIKLKGFIVYYQYYPARGAHATNVCTCHTVALDDNRYSKLPEVGFRLVAHGQCFQEEVGGYCHCTGV